MKILRQHKIWNNSIARGNKQGNEIIRTFKAERSRKLGIEKREGMFASTNWFRLASGLVSFWSIFFRLANPTYAGREKGKS